MPADLAKLRIIHYPDPRLRQTCKLVTRFDDDLVALVTRMFELMRADRGIGLAAPQVGVMLRLFVMNATGEPGDDHVVINPELRDLQQLVVAEEGCLSIPEVRVQVRRAEKCWLKAQDLSGKSVEAEGRDLVARIWQHETDHLNGVLIIDRMGPADAIAAKKTLRALEGSFRSGGR